MRFDWHGAHYRIPAPEGTTLPALLSVTCVAEPPPGELIVVLRRTPGLRALFRKAEGPPFQEQVRALPVA